MLKELAHLQEQLGDERFEALIDPDNDIKVKEFCDGLVKDSLPTEMTVGGRTYDILRFLWEDKRSEVSHLVNRIKEMNANLGKEDGEYILKHQNEIPVSLREKANFVFSDWRDPDPDGFESTCCVVWGYGEWVQNTCSLSPDCWLNGFNRVLRRK